MGIFEKLRNKFSPKTTIKDPVVSFLDETGAQIHVTHEQWRDAILPTNLTLYRDNPEQLSVLIGSALQSGLFVEVLDAARHLSGIDPQPFRGTCLYAIALMKTGHLKEAEEVLRSCMKEHGEDGTLLTNLAKIQAERNDLTNAQTTLWHALEVDPNVENALSWYAALAHDRGGRTGEIQAWQSVAALPGSWRPQLQIARCALENHNLPQALTFYREAVSRAPRPVPDDLLVQMTGDLGAHGYFEQVVELGNPLYSSVVHRPLVANNLIKAYFDLGAYARARLILDQLEPDSKAESKPIVEYWQERLKRR